MRLFVSSTFRDLEPEREILRRQVYPIVRQACEARGGSFFEIDLRWGVTREEAERGRVLSICLDEIDRCRPYILGIIGGRYGWIDPDARTTLEAGERFLALVPFADRSVTEIELRYAILNRPHDAPAPQALIYRRPAASAVTADGKLSGFHAFADELKAASTPLVDTSDDLDAFASRVRDDLLGLIEQCLPKVSASGQKKARREAAAVAAALGHRFVSVQAHEQLLRLVRGRAQRIAVIGPPGSGKSMLVAALVRDIQHGACGKADVVAAIRPAAWSDWPEAMDSLVAQLQPASQRLSHVGGIVERLHGYLRAAAERGHVVAVIDGVDSKNLSHEQVPAWCPEAIKNVTTIVTLRADASAHAAFRREGWQVVQLGPIDRQEAAGLAEQYFSPLGRRLEPPQLAALTERPRSPLELALALEELRCVPRFEDVDAAIEHLAKLETVEQILDVVFERLLREQGRPAQAVLAALALAPDGMPETALRAVAGDGGAPLAPLRFELLREALAGVAATDAERLTLRSSLFADHIVKAWLPGGTEAARRSIIEALRGEPETPGAAEEVLRHLLVLRDWQGLAEALGDPAVFDTMARRAGQQLRAYWARLREHDPTQSLAVYATWGAIAPPRRVAEAAALAEDLGDADTAACLAQDAVDRARGNEPAAFAMAATVLAGLAEGRGAFDEALTLFASLDTSDVRAAVPIASAVAAVRCARVVLARSGSAAAREALDASRPVIAATGDEELNASVAAMRGAIALAAGDVRSARTIYEDLRRIGDRLGNLAILAAAEAGLAKVERQRGKLRQAGEAAVRARRFADIAGDDRILQDVLGIAGRIAMDLGDYDEARKFIDYRRGVTGRIGDVLGALEADHDLARLYAAVGDDREGERLEAEVRARARQLGILLLGSAL